MFPWRVLLTTMVSRLEDTRQIKCAFGADNEGHFFTTTMPSQIETFRISAINRYLQEQARDAISRAQHTTRRENSYLATGTLGHKSSSEQSDSRSDLVGPSKSGLWLGPAPVIMTEAVQQWSAFYDKTNCCRLGVTWKQTDQMSSHSAPSMQ